MFDVKSEVEIAHGSRPGYQLGARSPRPPRDIYHPFRVARIITSRGLADPLDFVSARKGCVGSTPGSAHLRCLKGRNANASDESYMYLSTQQFSAAVGRLGHRGEPVRGGPCGRRHVRARPTRFVSSCQTLTTRAVVREWTQTNPPSTLLLRLRTFGRGLYSKGVKTKTSASRHVCTGACEEHMIGERMKCPGAGVY